MAKGLASLDSRDMIMENVSKSLSVMNLAPDMSTALLSLMSMLVLTEPSATNVAGSPATLSSPVVAPSQPPEKANSGLGIQSHPKPSAPSAPGHRYHSLQLLDSL